MHILPCIGLALALAGAAPVPPAAEPHGAVFQDVTLAWGIDFAHHSGPSLRFPPEAIGPGVALLDYDGDGLLDLYFVNGGEAMPDDTIGVRHPDRLYRNRGDGRFEEVTLPAGLVGRGIGCGATACDFDNDGYVDMYLSGYHENVLYRNNGDGTFTDVTGASGIRNPGFGASSAFGDYDRDGNLDLYIGNYVQFTYRGVPRSEVITGPRGELDISTLSPTSFFGEDNRLFRNRGDGTFEDATQHARVGNNERHVSRSMGVVFTDLDGDGWPDLLVANDTAPMAYFHNQRNGSFKNVAEQRWLDDSHGNMGLAVGDYNGDGLLDVYVTHFSSEHAELYVQTGKSGTFAPQGEATGLTASDYWLVGWGCAFTDYDADGWLDLVVANGHLYPDHIRKGQIYSGRIDPMPQCFEVFHNRAGARFDDVTLTAVEPRTPVVGARGLAVGDLDNDGAPDVVLAVNNGPAVVLKNICPHVGRRLAVELVGTRGNRAAVGARVEAVSGGGGPLSPRISREMRAGNGYLSTDSSVLDLGLGAQQGPVLLRVQWPAGRAETYRVAAGQRRVRLVEGQGTP